MSCIYMLKSAHKWNIYRGIIVLKRTTIESATIRKQCNIKQALTISVNKRSILFAMKELLFRRAKQTEISIRNYRAKLKIVKYFNRPKNGIL